MKKIGRVLGLAFTALALLGTPASWGLSKTIELAGARRGPVTFTHWDHAFDYQVECRTCHHNIEMVRWGVTTCKGCHLNDQHEGLCHQCHFSGRDSDFEEQSAAAAAALGVERLPSLYSAFHGLCRGCHEKENGGPAGRAPWECRECHIPGG